MAHTNLPKGRIMTGEKSCGSCFNFCLVAKIIVGIPAIGLIAALVASQFVAPWQQLLSAAATVFVMVYLAIKIDQIPALSKKIITRDCKK
jgi:uncharacterized membrane protein